MGLAPSRLVVIFSKATCSAIAVISSNTSKGASSVGPTSVDGDVRAAEAGEREDVGSGGGGELRGCKKGEAMLGGPGKEEAFGSSTGGETRGEE